MFILNLSDEAMQHARLQDVQVHALYLLQHTITLVQVES